MPTEDAIAHLIKVLKPELGAVLGVARFLSGIQVTANLQPAVGRDSP